MRGPRITSTIIGRIGPSAYRTTPVFRR